MKPKNGTWREEFDGVMIAVGTVLPGKHAKIRIIAQVKPQLKHQKPRGYKVECKKCGNESRMAHFKIEDDPKKNAVCRHCEMEKFQNKAKKINVALPTAQPIEMLRLMESSKSIALIPEKKEKRRFPEHWKVGMIVRHRTENPWAWNKGDLAIITRVIEPNKKGSEYQLLFSSPLFVPRISHQGDPDSLDVVL